MRLSDSHSARVAIACGGTGGHLFPGIAVARELLARGHSVTLFVSQKEVDQRSLLGIDGMDVQTLPAVGLVRGGRWAFLRGMIAARSVARSYFRKENPDAVLSMGGFTSGPPILAGRSCGAATLLHESNTIPGRANRWLAHVVDECLVGFDEAVSRLWCTRVTFTGTPVREEFQPMEASAQRAALGLHPQKPMLLVMGGSQGASGINDRFLKALPLIAAGMPDLQYVHLTGASGVETARAEYKRLQRRSVVQPFLSEMDLALGASTVAISRAGASSLAELSAVGVPSILIPYPTAIDNHQYHNAMAFASSGAAVALNQSDLTPELLARESLKILSNPVRRQTMADAAFKWHVPDAAIRVANRVEWNLLVKRAGSLVPPVVATRPPKSPSPRVAQAL